MPRPKRQDEPGAWFHVTNRGIARRPAFPDRGSTRHFLAQLALAHRTGLLEVHAYSVLTTHYHLLVRSPSGQMAVAMQRVGNRYVRWFNRRARRDGPLFRGRYSSSRIDTDEYHEAVVRYIDRNAVDARMVSRAESYPFGSARDYVRGRGPRWLTRTWIESRVARHAGGFGGPQYSRVFPSVRDGEDLSWVERRLEAKSATGDPFEDLVELTGPSVAAWMERKSRLADGCPAQLPCVAIPRLLSRLSAARLAEPSWQVPDRAPDQLWECAGVALLRLLAGVTWAEAGLHMKLSASVARKRAALHARLLESEPGYASRLAELGAECLGAAKAGRG